MIRMGRLTAPRHGGYYGLLHDLGGAVTCDISSIDQIFHRGKLCCLTYLSFSTMPLIQPPTISSGLLS